MAGSTTQHIYVYSTVLFPIRENSTDHPSIASNSERTLFSAPAPGRSDHQQSHNSTVSCLCAEHSLRTGQHKPLLHTMSCPLQRLACPVHKLMYSPPVIQRVRQTMKGRLLAATVLAISLRENTSARAHPKVVPLYSTSVAIIIDSSTWCR
jgi:hypothetical protein